MLDAFILFGFAAALAAPFAALLAAPFAAALAAPFAAALLLAALFAAGTGPAADTWFVGLRFCAPARPHLH